MRIARPRRMKWCRRVWQLGPPPATQSRVLDRAAGLTQFDQVVAAEADIPPAARSQLFEPAEKPQATVVIWHGFTNAPSQFTPAAGALAKAAGVRVILPRMPYQGEHDPLTRDLAKLTPEQLVAHLDQVIDFAASFGNPVWVAGLSGGGNVAAWAAATRDEVDRLFLIAPSVAPFGCPVALVRFAATHPRLVPNLYWWWDPRVKEKLEGSPYAYPGFPLPGMVAYLQLSEWLIDGTVTAGHELERVVLLTNHGDFAVRRGVARQFTSTVFGAQAGYLGEARIDPGLKWMHDFVDPTAGAGSALEVAAILQAGFGVGDPAAGGVLVPPLVSEQG